MSPQDHANLPTVLPPENEGVASYRLSTNAAGLCAAIVKATAQTIQGKKYVRVEGWQALAIAHGCVASSRDVEPVEGGIRAIGEVRRMSDGFVIATAEGFVGDDEKTWASRPMFARRAMTQTRAISRACRSAFAHVVVMIDRSLSTTPAEEMQGVYEGHAATLSNPTDYVAEAVKDGLAKEGAPSQYETDKLKAAIAADWKVTNKTAKGQLSQIGTYLDMARNPDDVSKILNNNEQVIANSGERDTIENDAAKLLDFFEAEVAKVHQ